MFDVIGFILASAGILYISRASLRARNSHGFYRFFAFEGIAGLFLLNWRSWFLNPFSPAQLISWAALLISLGLAIHGVSLLRRLGKPDARRQDSPVLGWEKTTRLVTSGAYRYIRHPLYSSLLFLAWGIFSKSPGWLGGMLAAVVTFFLVRTAQAEEGENLRFFGEEYQNYMRRTKMFIPFLF